MIGDHLLRPIGLVEKKSKNEGKERSSSLPRAYVEKSNRSKKQARENVLDDLEQQQVSNRDERIAMGGNTRENYSMFEV